MKKSTENNPNFTKLEKNNEGKYISPEDPHSHEHASEARRIGTSTQMERLRSWINRMMAHLGINVFETARYAELDYFNATIYADDSAVPSEQVKPSYYWIGHASNLVVIPTSQQNGNNRPLHVLTDPVEGALFPGLYPRQTKEGKLIKGQGENRLPRVDVIVISHNHRDHVDIGTLKRLVDQQPKMVVPEGDRALFINLGFENVEELNWGESVKIQHGEDTLLEITSVPARHWSGRGLHDAHRSVFSGYVLQTPSMPHQDIYFAGDTAELGDDTARAIYNSFDIGLSIQPGGPDENRRDMESTHQSSADGITAHFRNIKAQYDKYTCSPPAQTRERPEQAQERVEPKSRKQFLNNIQHIKTIYDHTATFKLGNLRLRDTYYSYNRILAVFRNGFTDNQAKTFLADHEFSAYEKIKTICKQIQFEENSLSNQDIADIIERDIIVPKIGERFDLDFDVRPGADRSTPSVFDARRLIINHRSLKTCDKMAMDWLEKQSHPAAQGQQQAVPQLMDSLILELLKSYRSVWHAKLTRTHLKEFDDIFGQSTTSVSEKLENLQEKLAYKNRHGHLQNIIHYAQWINKTVTSPEALNDFLTRLHVRQLVDVEVRNTGSWFILENRGGKIRRFQELAGKLEKAESLQEYKAVFESWKKENSANLSMHRSGIFNTNKPTHSEKVLEQIERMLKRP